MTLNDFFSSLTTEESIERLESQLVEAVSVDDMYLNEIATHLIKAGGKRLRPALTICAASTRHGEIKHETIMGAVSVELVHLASLYHDDVMDEAVKRRNVASVNALWGNRLAIVVGDYLLARSAEIAASLGSEIASLIAATLSRLCHGQVTEVRSCYDVNRTQEQYLESIADKTASLTATACRIGGITAGLGMDEIDALTVYGENLGMIFQIRDDVLDVVATEEFLRKPPGQDLAEGVYTMPACWALQNPSVGEELASLLGRPLTPEQLTVARRLIISSDAIERTAVVAKQYAKTAQLACEKLSNTEVATKLANLADNLLLAIDTTDAALAS
ncbi:MAG: polyprenyl synthetase family protein [Firmicutes bacterium]|nr:polyprenyl synthetase family protein [Bacillota bacterium]